MKLVEYHANFLTWAYKPFNDLLINVKPQILTIQAIPIAKETEIDVVYATNKTSQFSIL